MVMRNFTTLHAHSTLPSDAAGKKRWEKKKRESKER